MSTSTGYVYTTNITGASGTIPTSNGTGSINWTTPYTINTSFNDVITIHDGKNSLQVKGDAEFLGDLKLQGKSLKDSLDKIEEKLAILHPNEELEEKWEQLRGLRKMYMELEAEIKEKEQMWAILKK